MTENVNVLTEDVNGLTEGVNVLTENVNVLTENVNVLTENVNFLTGLPGDVNYLPENVNKLTYNVDGYSENVIGSPEYVNGLPENVNSLPENINVLVEDVNVLTEKEIKIEVCLQKARPAEISPKNSKNVQNPTLIKNEVILVDTESEASDDLNVGFHGFDLKEEENVNCLTENANGLTENVNGLRENVHMNETENQQENYQNVESVRITKINPFITIKKHEENEIHKSGNCSCKDSNETDKFQYIDNDIAEEIIDDDNMDDTQQKSGQDEESVPKLKKPYLCQICGTGFSGKLLLKRHNRSVHEQGKVWDPKACCEGISSKAGLKRHIETVHGGKKPLKCSECDRDTFRSNSDLKAHIEQVHKKNIMFECGHCGKNLSNKNSKERHERKFPNALCIKMPFECELCPYRNQFKLRSSLYRHIKTFHKGKNATILKENVKELKPFSCEKCKKNFSSMDLLKRHEKKNCAIVILKCKYCDKTFLKRKLLTVHERYRGKLKNFFQFLSKFYL